MITDEQGVQILKIMNEQFTKIDERFAKIDERFTKIDEQFAKIDEQFAKIDEQFAKIDERFAKIDERFAKIDEQFNNVNTQLENVIFMAVNSQHAINELLTREEFEERFEKYQEENLEFKHVVVKRLEVLEEFAS